MPIPLFFGAAIGGYLLMAVVGIQALIALFSSIPLAKRRHLETSEFDLKKARRRITRIILTVSVLVAVVTSLLVLWAPISATSGYLFGMILAFVCSIKRMSPNDARNQAHFSKTYADCYPADDTEIDELNDTVILSSKSSHDHQHPCA